MDVVIGNSEKPIYEQIYEQISSQILNGELRAGEMLPSIRALARDLRISVITVKSAWEMLENGGFIVTRQGKGWIVRDNQPQALRDKRMRLAEERLKKDLPFYKGLGLSKDELIELISKQYE